MEEAIKKALNNVKEKNIDTIRFVEFFFDYLLPVSKERNIDLPTYVEIMSRMELMGIVVFEEACIWRVKV